MKNQKLYCKLAGFTLGAAFAMPMNAQEVLPFPPKPSGSVAGKLMQESTYAPLPLIKHLPKNAPNILIVLIDDVGPAQAGTYGGEIHTPTLSRIASEGISFNQFHTTAMCSPTRAAPPYSSWTFPGAITRMPEFSAPALGNKANIVTVEADVPASANGVLYALGGFSGGLTCYVKDGMLSYEYNLFEIMRTDIKAKEKLPTGKVRIAVETSYVELRPAGPPA